jgi:hypothetical protein
MYSPKKVVVFKGGTRSEFFDVIDSFYESIPQAFVEGLPACGV